MRKLVSIAFIVLVTIPVECRGQASAPALRLIQTIRLPNVKGRIDHFNVDLKHQRLFISALGNHTLEVVDLKSGKWVRSIPNVKKPQGVWYVDSLDRLFIADGDGGNVKVYDGNNLKLIASIRLDLGPDWEAYDPVTKDLYVGYGGEDAGKNYGELGIIDTVTNQHIGDVRTDSHPSPVIIAKPGKTVLVNCPKERQVNVVDEETRHITAKWQTKEDDPAGLAVDAADQRVFVGTREPPRLLVFDFKSHQLIADLPTVGLLDGLYYDRARRRIYASGGEGFVAVYQQIDPDHYKEISKIPTGPNARTSLLVPSLDRYYVAVPAHDQTNAELMVFEPQP